MKTDKEEFELRRDRHFNIIPRKDKTGWMISDDDANGIYDWFQSKQQEKIERVKKLKEDFYPKDRFNDGYQMAISDVLSILEEE